MRREILHTIISCCPIMQKVRHHKIILLWLLIWVLIQVLFHQSSTYFSSFPLQYYSLSLNMPYLAWKMVLPTAPFMSTFEQLISRSTLLIMVLVHKTTKIPQDCHLLWFKKYLFQGISLFIICKASPRSLAATCGVSVDFLSSSYYNVLVH